MEEQENDMRTSVITREMAEVFIALYTQGAMKADIMRLKDGTGKLISEKTYRILVGRVGVAKRTRGRPTVRDVEDVLPDAQAKKDAAKARRQAKKDAEAEANFLAAYGVPISAITVPVAAPQRSGPPMRKPPVPVLPEKWRLMTAELYDSMTPVEQDQYDDICRALPLK
jgi:hypothetical protein